MKIKKQFLIIPLASLVIVLGSFLAYYIKVDFNDLTDKKLSQDQFREALSVTRGGFRTSFSNISTAERKELRESGSLTTADIVRDDQTLSELEYETDSVKIREAIAKVIKRIKSYDPKYQHSFEVTIHRLTKIIKYV